MTRRSLAGTLALGGLGAVLGWPSQGRETSSGAAVSITVNLNRHIATVPGDYSGLSYESAQLAHPDFFAPTNKVLIAFFRRLSKQGVLPIGGDSREYAMWSPTGSATAGTAGGAVGPHTGNGSHRRGLRRRAVTPEAIHNLAGFLDATGWQLIYGLNLGHGIPEKAAQEAKAVSDAVGPRLIAFQIGNEPDLYHRGRPWDLRPAGWNFNAFFWSGRNSVTPFLGQFLMRRSVRPTWQTLRLPIGS